MRYLKYVLSLVIVGALAACGGGNLPDTTTGSGAGSGTTGSGTTGTGTTAAAPTLTMQLFSSSGATASSVTYGGGNYAKATLLGANGAPVGSKLVTFSLNGATIATLSPSAGTALTDSNGVAQIALAPASPSAAGAASLTATSTVGTATVTGQTDFAVSASSITLGALTVSNPSIQSGGSTGVSVTATVGGVSTPGVNVGFATDCGSIDSVVTTSGNGVANATYSAIKSDGTVCSGIVTVTASATGATPKTASVTVAAPVANAINFVSASPSQIYIKGSGATEQAVVTFKVLGSSGAAMPNVPVTFSLTANPGGVGIGSSGSTSNVTYQTDPAGVVSVSVFSGTIPGPVTVQAALVSDPTVFTVTKNLTVASGPPSQDFFSLSVQTFNIEGWGIDGTSTNLTIRVADRQGNAVPDGTVVNFTAEGGQIGRSCATTTIAGISQCTVGFISQNPRPSNGRVSILAYTEGLKKYTDINQNNAYDIGTDTLFDLGDAYRDDNENGQYDLGEFVIPKGGAVVCAGVGEPFPSRVNTCTGPTTLAATVRQQAVILFSSSSPYVTNTAASTSEVAFELGSADNLLLPMPAGTTITAATGSLTAGSTCAVAKVYGSPVVNVNPGTNPAANLRTTVQIPLNNCVVNDNIVVTITAPSGLVTFQSFKLQ